MLFQIIKLYLKVLWILWNFYFISLSYVWFVLLLNEGWCLCCCFRAGALLVVRLFWFCYFVVILSWWPQLTVLNIQIWLLWSVNVQLGGGLIISCFLAHVLSMNSWRQAWGLRLIDVIVRHQQRGVAPLWHLDIKVNWFIFINVQVLFQRIWTLFSNDFVDDLVCFGLLPRNFTSYVLRRHSTVTFVPHSWAILMRWGQRVEQMCHAPSNCISLLLYLLIIAFSCLW